MPSSLINSVFTVKILPEEFFDKVKDLFGFRPWRNQEHKGIDLAARIGTEVRTPYSGIVTQSHYNERAGNILKIKHDDEFETRYLHLSGAVSGVEVGAKVNAGQIVAKTGNTGKTTGPHLHFEVIINNKQVDPAPYLYGSPLEDDGNKGFKFNNKIVFNKSNDFINNTNLKFTSQQLNNAKIIVDTCKELKGTKRDAIIAVSISLEKSKILGLNLNGSDSYGLFQLSPSLGWGTKEELYNMKYSSKIFFTGTATQKGLLGYKNRENESIEQITRKIGGSDKYAYSQHIDDATSIVNHLWGEIIDSKLDGYNTELNANIKEEVVVDDYLASGIWQIIKVVIDPEVADRKINDATISFMQGSLYNFFEKVCQKPFVEFWGDTYGDQYYFIVRKPPFTRKSFMSLDTIEVIEDDVYNDSLGWNNDTIYSWFQLVPNGNYIGGEEVIYQYLSAVYFPEYGEIWGSRPLSITTNYITFIKGDGKVQLQNAVEDLRFLVDIHSYLPFTRSGTITMRGDRRIKRGTRILYKPTNEYYYVDSVSNNFTSKDGVLDSVTTLNVSRGMVAEYVDIEIEDDKTPSYFNLINYGDEKFAKSKNIPEKQLPEDAYINLITPVAFFNQGSYTFKEEDVNAEKINNENNIGETDRFKNIENCKKIAELADKYKNLEFVLIGYTDSEASSDSNITLGQNRADTVRNCIIYFYNKLPNRSESEKEEIYSRIKAHSYGEERPHYTNETPDGRFKNRRVDVMFKHEYEKLKNKDKNKNVAINTPDNGNWHVNKEVFLFFLRRRQFTINEMNGSK